MSFFGAYRPSDVAQAAGKFIAKMDESSLAAEIAFHQAAMNQPERRALVESILDAFRSRGESSEDVAEAARTTVEGMQRADVPAVEALLKYVAQNAGLLKEAAAAVVEKDTAMLRHLPGSVLQRVSEKLASL